MIMEQQHTKTGWWIAALVAAFVALTWSIARSIIWIEDDVAYQLCNVRGFPRLTEFWQVFSSMANHYISLNGRFTAHFIVQCFCAFWGQEAFAICNSIVMCLCVWLIMRLAGARMKDIFTLASVMMIALTVYLIPYGPSFMVGYLWMITASLWWIWEWQKPRKASLWGIALMFLLSIVIGNGQEVISPGMLAGAALYALQRRRRISARQWWMLAGYAIGTVAIFGSPGTQGRFGGNFLSNVGVIRYINIIIYHKVLWVVVAVVLWMKWRKGVRLRDIYRRNMLWVNVVAMLFLAQATVHLLYYRQSIGTEIAATVLLLRLLPSRSITWRWTVALVVPTAAVMCYMVVDMLNVNALVRSLQKQWRESPTGEVWHDFEHYFGPEITLHPYEYHVESLNLLLAADGINKPIKWLPEGLKGKDLKNPKNEVIRMRHGEWLVVINRHNPPKRCLSTWTRNLIFYQSEGADYEFNPEHISIRVVDTDYCLAVIVMDKSFYNPCVGVRLE